MQFLAKTGSNKEMPRLHQFVPEYFSTIQNRPAARTALRREAVDRERRCTEVRTLAASPPADAAGSRAPAASVGHRRAEPPGAHG